MIIKKNEMKLEVREKMRGGQGNIRILHLEKPENLNHARLMAHITIPVNGSIGEHNHLNETEYFIILSGQGEVNDNGELKEIQKGDVVVTPHSGSHAIKNTGQVELEMIALIIKD